MKTGMGKARKLTLAVLIAALLFTTGNLLSTINYQRTEYNLTVDMPLEDAPPELVLITTALGGFRGIIVNYLWVRAMELQQEGKYFELVQLYDWIGRLQPRFETVWVYAGWNMAYNISVKLTTPPERWAWINRGIEILRDEGLRYNPRNPRMHRELGWIYFHKIGQLMDDFHWEYKFYLADRMSRIVGPGNAFMESLAEMYNISPSELMEDEEVSELASRLRDEGLDPFGRDFRQIVLGYREPPEGIEYLLEDERWEEPGAKLANFARLRELTEEHKLHPGRMIELREEYGPLDWRLAQSIALYWLTKGAEVSDEEPDVNHDRLILQCLISLTENGRLVITDAGMPATEPDFRFIEPTDRFYEHLVEKYEGAPYFEAGHENFLQTMVINLFTYGDREKARSTYARLREVRPGGYTEPMEDFVINRIMDRVGEASVPEISSLIGGIIRQALYELALGNDERASGMEKLAEEVWEKHMRQYEDIPRMHLPPFPDIRRHVVDRALDGEFPEDLLPYLRRRLRREN